jgi:hypothetical protein
MGSFFTLLPDDADLSRLYEFPYGGIMPQGLKGRIEIEGLGSYFAEKINSSDEELSEFILFCLKKNNDRVCIMEDYNSTPDSPHVKIENVEMHAYENEVYHFLYSVNSTKEIKETIKTSNTVWHFLSVLSSVDKQNLSNSHLSLDDLNKICTHADGIIAGAYDREGYIFWMRNVFP